MHRAVSALFTPEPLRAIFTQAQTERLHCKSTTNFASCKTKHRLFLAVCKIPCTFAAKLVLSLYNRSDAKMKFGLIKKFFKVIHKEESAAMLIPHFYLINYHQISW